MSNTSSHISTFSHNSIKSPRNHLVSSESSEDAIVRDLKREKRELLQLASQFKWEDNANFIEEEGDDLNFLNKQVQIKNQEAFSTNFIKNLNIGRRESDHRLSYDSSAPSTKQGFLQESPQMLDEDEDEEDKDDPEYTYEKVTESGLNSDDESLGEEYDSDFEGDGKFEKMKKSIRSNNREVLSEVEYWLALIITSKVFQGLVACFVLLLLIIFLASAIVHTNNTTRYHDPRTNYHTQYIPVDSLTEVNSKLKRFQSQLEDLSSKQYKIASENEKMTDAIQKTQQTFNKNWDHLTKKFIQIQNYVDDHVTDRDVLLKQFTSINDKLKNYEEQLVRGKEIDIDHSKHLSDIFQQVSSFESDLIAANNKIEELMNFKSRVEDVFSSIKEDVLEAMLDRLPSIIPIIKSTEGQIQMFPEVYDYLSEVIKNTVSNQLSSIDLENVKRETEMTWDNFLKENEIELNQYLTQFVNTDLKLVKRQDFEKILVENFKANRDKLDKELLKIKGSIDQNMNLLDSKISRILHTSGDRINLSESTSGLLIEHLIDKRIDENALKIEGRANYADAEQGLGIIKSLTSDNIKSHLRKRKTIAGRALLGWYDFLRRVTFGGNPTLSRRSIDNPKNVLLDNKSYWISLVNDSHIGIRLAKDILLTDILFKHPRNDNPLIVTSAPRKVSIYVKPSTNDNQVYLKQAFLDKYDQDFIPKLSHFTKITEFEYDINNSHIYQFVNIPKEYLKLNIQIRDLYFDVESNWGHDQVTSLHNIKVFGINNDDIKNVKLFLNLDKNASAEEVIDEFRDKFVNKATYVVDSQPFHDAGVHEIGIEF